MLEITQKLNASNSTERLLALEETLKIQDKKPNFRENDANNHIHTIYSFSPYSPTLAAYMAYSAGLTSAGIMDHDSLSGAKEFKSACKTLNLGSTCGVEVRAKFNKGFGKINHPDQSECIYMAAHGVALKYVDEFNDYLAYFRQKRNERNDRMCKLITEKYSKFDISLDFEKDVAPLSRTSEGGSVTERHLLYALAIKISNRFQNRQDLIGFLKNTLELSISEKINGYLLDEENPHFLYDLVGVLKADTKFFYIDADEEMPIAEEFIKKAKSFGAIPAYAYLGDVGDSVTGDKKAQKFEDDYLEDLFVELKKAGFLAIAYMPTRNTPEQLQRLQGLCKKYGMFEISGEDINSPRQQFCCKALALKEYAHLIDSTWALIGHEYSVETYGIESGMFSEKSIKETPDINERIKKYAEIGKKTIKDNKN
ncbi:MAG: PHP domain-containing protein [Clostridia bacterium]|nr:PHP domain-containing protein [Clostridia bacterium]